MRKIFLACVCLCSFAFPVMAQEGFAERLAKIEANNKAIAEKVAADHAALTAKVDGLAKKVEDLISCTCPTPPRPAAAGKSATFRPGQIQCGPDGCAVAPGYSGEQGNYVSNGRGVTRSRFFHRERRGLFGRHRCGG